MKVLHVIDSHALKEGNIYRVHKGLGDYKRFFNMLVSVHPELVHFHAVGKETFGIYALIARCKKIKVVRTIHAPMDISYWFIVKQLCARFFYNHTIVTSKFDTMHVDKFHMTAKSKRSLIYRGVDSKKYSEFPKREVARAYIYKQLGISFTKNIRIIGTIIQDDKDNGIEHLIDAAYLADKYKNLTNTIFIILSKGNISQDVRDQIAELHVEGICLVVEDFENPEEYIKAFDIFISPRTKSGDLDIALLCMYLHVPIIVTKVGDMKEFEQCVAAPLVPSQSAKFLTEATMYVIRNENPTNLKTLEKNFVLPKKFSAENEFIMIHEIYSKVLKYKGAGTRKLLVSNDEIE